MEKIALILFLLPLLSNGQINQKDEQGRRHGVWKVNFEGSNNPKFEGEFNHGLRTGEFKFYKKGFYKHPSAIMHFQDAKDSVAVTYYTQEGKPISTGKMLDQKREGTWVYFHQKSDSLMMTEVYKNDKLNGYQKTYFPNGELAEKTNYVNGKKDGESFIYTSKEQVNKHLQYKNGELNGPAIYYNIKGEKIIEGEYTQGKKSGTWRYFEDGTLNKEIKY